VVPNDTVSSKYPVTIAEPSDNAFIDEPISNPVPPALVTQIQLPDESIFATNISFSPDELNVIVPNVAELLKLPITIAEPSDNAVIDLPDSGPIPPAFVTQIQLPEESIFATNISVEPNELIVVLPNVAELEKRPDIKANESSGNTDIDKPESKPEPPALVIQSQLPDESNFATNRSL
jgi:hypothetical protein